MADHPPISGLPEIGKIPAQVGYSRLVMLRPILRDGADAPPQDEGLAPHGEERRSRVSNHEARHPALTKR